MKYAITGLYVIVAGAGIVLFRILHQLKLSDTYNQIRQALQDVLKEIEGKITR